MSLVIPITTVLTVAALCVLVYNSLSSGEEG